MEEQGSTHSYQKSESYPSPRSHSSQSLQDTNSTSPEQKQEGEQKPQGSQDTTKAMSLTFSTEISNSASLDSLPVSKTTNGETLEQNGIQIPNEMHREQHMSTQISEEHQQQLCRSSAVASTTAVLAATQPTTNPQLNHPALSLNAYLPHSGTRTGSQMTINHTPQAAALHYSLTPHGTDERIMTGSRSRKEIKRRTKTGCLTCRKRRIKVIFCIIYFRSEYHEFSSVSASSHRSRKIGLARCLSGMRQAEAQASERKPLPFNYCTTYYVFALSRFIKLQRAALHFNAQCLC